MSLILIRILLEDFHMIVTQIIHTFDLIQNMLHKSLDAARVCGELHFYAVISIISCSQALLTLAI